MAYYITFNRWFSGDSIRYTIYDCRKKKIQAKGWNLWETIKPWIDQNKFVSDFERTKFNMKRSTHLSEDIGHYPQLITFDIPMDDSKVIVFSIGNISLDIEHDDLLKLQAMLNEVIRLSENVSMESLLCEKSLFSFWSIIFLTISISFTLVMTLLLVFT